MIEIIFLLVILPRRIRVLAKERGESVLKWSLFAIGAWIGAEILVGIVLGVIWGVLTGMGVRLPQNVDTILFILYYILMIVSAATAATLVIRMLRSKPVLV